MPWTFIALGAAFIVLTFLFGLVRGWSEEVRARRALHAAREGRFAGRPMRVVPTLSTSRWPRVLGGHSGRAYRDGGDIVVLVPGQEVRVALGDLATAKVRTTLDEDTESVREVYALVDEGGQPHELQVPDYVSPALAALRGTPAPPVRGVDRLVSAVPWGLLVLAVALAIPLAVHQVAWHTGHDVAATVAEVDADGGYCTVEWGEAGRDHVATLDCYEPYPTVGDELTIRATAGPLTGQAMDYEGAYEAGLVLLGIPMPTTFLAAGLVTVLRLRGRPLRLTTARAVSPAGAADPGGVGVAARGRGPSPVLMGMRELATEVACSEGWAQGLFGTAYAHSTLQRLRMAVVTWPFFIAFAALLLGWGLPEEVPTPWSWPLTGVAALAALYALVASGRALHRLLEPTRVATTRPVEIVTVRTVAEDWLTLIFEPGAAVPSWLLAFDADARPPVTATGEVRGVLEEGRAVRLAMFGEEWEPSGPVVELDDEIRTELREDLLDRLASRPGEAWWEREPSPAS